VREAARRLVECAALAVVAVGLATTGARAAPFVYVTNALSANVSQYDAAGGALAPLSPPTIGTGDNTIGAATSPDGKNVYVTTQQPAGVFQFSVGANGTLTLQSSATVPATVGPGKPAVSPDGGSVYVINSGGDQALLQYTVEANGALTPKSPPTVPTGPGPTQVAVSPDSRSVYVTNTVSGLNTVSQYTAAADGTLSPKSPATVPTSGDALAEPIGVAVSPDGRNVYVANSEADPTVSGNVAQYSAGADGTLSPKSPATVPAGVDPYEVTVSRDGASVYVTDSQEAGAVLQYTVGATGALTPKSPATVAAGTFPLGIAVSCDGRSVYAANAGDATVSQYSVGATGTLSPRSPAAVAAGTNPLEIAVTPTARIPVSKDQCKNGGWRNFPDFKNQGDCVSYVATGGENQPSGH
jgi:6-phosphogluconolactonase